ncbi:MAG: efflux RND transporter periplasmic adaptor subunit [Candidatus Aminicenantes bacterium]|nr:efflux RND transporter periplasmic adaptor subunit [Candidatus Aminicenantes bacterium]
MIIPKKFLVLFLVVVFAGFLFYFLGVKQGIFSSKKETIESASDESVETTETPLPVKARKVERGELVIKLRSPGEAVTDRMVVVKTEVSGKVSAFHVKEGQAVQKGELLVELDNREFQLEVEKAEASRLKILSELLLDNQFAEKSSSESASFMKIFEAEKKIYDKVYQQYQQELISEEEFERAFKKFEMKMIESGQKKDDIMAATKGLTQQEINVKKARLNLEKTRITAPFSGIITDIKALEQQQVTASFELFTIVDINRVNVHARVLESEIGKMQIGSEVDLFFSAFPDEVIKGKVKVVSPLVNNEDKTCKVIISVEHSSAVLKPGMHAEVEIEADIFKDRLLVPKEAIVVRSGKKMVFVVEEDRARRRYIETGQENDYFAEVLESSELDSGLREGDVVIVEGHLSLAQNAQVRIIDD